MRQTGRTSRIVDFAIDQLFSCGSVIVADHYVFEADSPKRANDHLIDLVYRRWEACHSHNLPHLKLEFYRESVRNKIGNTNKPFEAIHFYLELKPTQYVK